MAWGALCTDLKTQSISLRAQAHKARCKSLVVSPPFHILLFPLAIHLHEMLQALRTERYRIIDFYPTNYCRTRQRSLVVANAATTRVCTTFPSFAHKPRLRFSTAATCVLDSRIRHRYGAHSLSLMGGPRSGKRVPTRVHI
jgi:hypothetical protein